MTEHLTEPWRNAPECPDHEDYQNGCEMCFAEAVEGGLGWLVDGVLRGTVATEMPAAGPFHKVFEVSFEGDRLFAVTYKEGGPGLMVPEDAQARVRELEDAARVNVAFWDQRIEFFRDAGNQLEEHNALRARGVAGARLDRIEHWDTDRLAVKPKAKAEHAYHPAGTEGGLMHDYHLNLPGADPRMILFDGCEECEVRAADPLRAIHKLDAGNALEMWRLMCAEKWSCGTGADRPVSNAEHLVLNALYSMGVFLERAGISPDEVEDHLRMVAR